MLQQLYQQSQNIIINAQQQLHYDLQSCIQQMQYHWLQILHLQYSGYSLSFPYTPSNNSQYLSYRHQEVNDESSDSESNDNQESIDDRLTIETCHGLIEYCSKLIN